MARKSTHQVPPTETQLLWKEFGEDSDKEIILAWKQWTADAVDFLTKKEDITSQIEKPVKTQEDTTQIEDSSDRTEDADTALKDKDGHQELSVIPAAHIGAATSLALYLRKYHADDDSNAQLSAQGYIPHTELYSGLWSNVSLLSYLWLSKLTPSRSTKA